MPLFLDGCGKSLNQILFQMSDCYLYVILVEDMNSLFEMKTHEHMRWYPIWDDNQLERGLRSTIRGLTDPF